MATKDDIEMEKPLSSNNNGGEESLHEGKFDKNQKVDLPSVESTKQSYHEQRLSQSKWAFRVSLGGSIAGFVIILISTLWGIEIGEAQWPGIISGVITEAVSALFFEFSHRMNDKISEFFNGLTVDDNIRRALELANTIDDAKVRDEVKARLALHLVGVNFNQDKKANDNEP